MKRLKIQISEADETTKIQQVSMSSNSNKLNIVVMQDKNSYWVASWDLINDAELEAHDMEGSVSLLYDFAGECYARDSEGRLFLMSDGCVLTCFGLPKGKHQTPRHFGPQHGFRIDPDNLSWIFNSGVINLSYSFMTFAINHETAKQMK